MADKVVKSSVPACKAASKKATPSWQLPDLQSFSPSSASWRQLSLVVPVKTSGELEVVAAQIAFFNYCYLKNFRKKSFINKTKGTLVHEHR